METMQVIETNSQSVAIMGELNRQAVLLSSSLHNMRKILQKDTEKILPMNKSRWSKRTINECDLLRERLDTLMGTIATVLSMRAQDYSIPVRISADDSKRALTDCIGFIGSEPDYNLEASLSLYESMLRTFIGSLCNDKYERATYQQASEYFEKTYRLSLLLSADEGDL